MRSLFVHSVGAFCLIFRTCGPMIRSCEIEVAINSKTSVNLANMASGQVETEEEKSTCSRSKNVPVSKRMGIAIHTSNLNRRADVKNHCWSFVVSVLLLKTGTTTSDRKSMPPTQKNAATKCVHLMSRLNQSMTIIDWV